VLRRGDEPVAQEKDYLTDAFTREAVSFIDRHKAEPFFLYMPYNAVHSPMFAPPRFREMVGDVSDPKRKTALAMLAALDEGVGRIVAKVREASLEQNTLIIFMSDNGGPTPENLSSNAPLRGYKGQVYEGGIRVAFMMQWPGKIPPKQVSDSPVISLDLFPTTLAAAGVTPRDGLKLDGVNLMPWVQSSRTDQPHDALYWRFTPQWAIREGNLKLLSSRKLPQPALYDLAADPAERTDLAAKQPDVVKRLREKYDAWNAHNIDPLWEGKQEGAHYDREPKL
jgi:arylsulfatase A-like enzyme